MDLRHWDARPLALHDRAETRPKLRSVTAAAAAAGVRAGMSLSEARALCAELDVLPWDDVEVNAAIAAMTARLVHASPQVSPVAGAPGMWWVGASGFADGARAAGGRGDATFAAEVLAVARAWHPRARVAVADSCVAARAATWSAMTGSAVDEPATMRSLVTVIPPGGDAAYLATAPLALLPMDVEMREALQALGVRRVGDFADLSAGDVEQRWGDEGLVAWRLAQGNDPRRPVLARVDDAPRVDMELATPADSMEPVLFLVRPAVERLVTQLVSQSRAVASLAVTLTLDDARGPLPSAQPHTVTREIRLPRPLARPAPLFERCRGLLSRWELSAPVIAVRLTVMLTSPISGEQGHLLDTSWKDPGAADAALERVRAELGPDVVVKPVERDGYVIERSGAWSEEPFSAAPHGRGSVFSATPSASITGHSSERRPIRREAPAEHVHPSPQATAENAFRLLESPELVDVDDPDAPRRVYWRGRAMRIIQAVGPERLSGDWWKDGYNRDYWRCACTERSERERDDDAGDLVLYRDGSGWWVQGWYD